MYSIAQNRSNSLSLSTQRRAEMAAVRSQMNFCIAVFYQNSVYSTFNIKILRPIFHTDAHQVSVPEFAYKP
jgi:hypothetical protein